MVRFLPAAGIELCAKAVDAVTTTSSNTIILARFLIFLLLFWSCGAAASLRRLRARDAIRYQPIYNTRARSRKPRRGYGARFRASLCSLALALQLRGVPRKGYGLILFLSRGNSVASLTLVRPRIFCVSRSSPIANPPCGGQPYLKIER